MASSDYKCAKIFTSSQVINCVVVLLFFLPESQILLEELDDTLSVTEVFLLELINLVKGFLQCLVSEFASVFVILHHFVVEYREIKGKSKFDWVAWLKCNTVSIVVSLKGLLFHFLKLCILCILGNVTVVVTNHLHEECLGFFTACLCENFGFNQ